MNRVERGFSLRKTEGENRGHQTRTPTSGIAFPRGVTRGGGGYPWGYPWETVMMGHCVRQVSEVSDTHR